MKKAKNRIAIPLEISARILFASDRTCCVCRIPGKPVQIHHIDDDPSNNELGNLSVLCLECHHTTQIEGGFARQLDSEQVVLYRDDWIRVVASRRMSGTLDSRASHAAGQGIELATSLAEIYREKKQYLFLAIHYDHLNNPELRDKYIELAIEQDSSAPTISFLRGLQGKPELIPPETIAESLKLYSGPHDQLQRARFFVKLKKPLEAAKDYFEGIHNTLKEDNPFSAAFYAKEMAEEGIVEALFIEALHRATKEGNLWWQVRAMQELGWRKELKELLIDNENKILQSQDMRLQQYLAEANGNHAEANRLQKEIARQGESMIGPKSSAVGSKDIEKDKP